MQLCSVPFAVLIIVGLALFHACRSGAQRCFVLLLLNFVFLSSRVETLPALLPLTGFLLLSLISIRLVNVYKSRTLFIVCLALLLGSFVYLKQYALARYLPALPLIYVTFGLSYFVFRVLRLLIDTYQQEEVRHDLSIPDMLGYFTSFLALTAGPIQRFEDYCRQQQSWNEQPALGLDEVLGVLGRVASGFLKLVFISPLLLGLHEHAVHEIARHHLAFGAAAAVYILYIYANFSGYMDIVIGLGRLFGFQLPENFNHPLLCANFLDLWSRWHITLSNWFKDYVFTPLLRFAMVRWDRPALLPYFGVGAYFFVFFLLGIWHGSSTRYVLLGLLFGLGASLNKLYEVELLNRLGAERAQALRSQTWYQMLARALALSFHAFSVAVTWEVVPGLRALSQLLRSVGVGGIIGSFLALVGAIVALQMVAYLGLGLWRRLALLPLQLGESRSSKSLALGFRMLLLLLLWSRSERSSEPALAAAATAPTTTTSATAPQVPTPKTQPLPPLYDPKVFYGKF